MNNVIRDLQCKAYELCKTYEDDGNADLVKTDDVFEVFAKLVASECIAQIQPMWDQVKKFGPPPGYDYDTFDLAYNDSMNAIAERFEIER